MAKPEVFARRMRELAEDIPRNAARAAAKVALRIGRQLVNTTPVDTGLARSNWLVGIGRRDMTPRASRPPATTIAEMNAKLSQLQPDVDIHIANGGFKVPYLGLLNQGSSFQAPANFVRIAFLAARDSAFQGMQLLKRRRR